MTLPGYEYDWNRAEHARAVRWLTWERMRRPWLRVLRGFVYLVVAVSLLIAGFSWSTGDRGGAVVTALLALSVLALTLWFPAVVAMLHTWRVARTDPNIGHPMRFSFDEDGLLVRCETAETRLHWTGMPRVAESPEFFLFFYSPVLAYYLPKRAVQDPDALRKTIDVAWRPGDQHA